MGATRNRWAVALRIARRSALTSWGRSLLIVALIAAPITGLSAAAVLLPSTQSTLAERIQGTLGHAQAKLTVVDSPGLGIEQGVEGGYDYTETHPGSTDRSTVDPRSALPAGTRTITVKTGAATFVTPHGTTSLQVQTGDTWDPALDGGPYALLSGRRPTAADQVLLSPAALSRLGAHVGGTIRTDQPARTLTVVGTLADRSAPNSTQIAFGADFLAPDASLSAVYVPSTPVDWALVKRLNAVGTTVFSREVVLNPPADAPAYSGGIGFNVATVVVIALAILFAVFEVSLLAGSAFLVGARLQQRSMAMIASVGADRSVLRRVVTANGVVLGAVGGAIGVALGIGGAALFMRLTSDGTWARYPGFHLVWPVLAGIAVFGVIVGWIAALVPARAASQFDVVRALRGARTPQRVGKRPLVGIVVLVVGVGTTLLGGAALFAALRARGDVTAPVSGAVAMVGGGSLLAQVGVVLCSGLILRGIAGLLRHGPLATRLAARDTSRNLGRAVPAVASVMTTVFIAAFVMCVANAASLQTASTYHWQLAKAGSAEAYISSPDPTRITPAYAARWAEVARRNLPVRDAQVIGQTPIGTDDATPSNRTRDAQAVLRPVADTVCVTAPSPNPADRRCGPFSPNGTNATGSVNPITVGNTAALAMLLGHAPSPEAIAVLQRGGAVALRYGFDRRGAVSIDWFTPKQLAGTVDESTKPRRASSLPAVVDLPVNPISDVLFVTNATAARLKLSAQPQQVLLDLTRPPTDAELDSADTALSALSNEPDTHPVQIETGPQDFGALVAWAILGACLLIAISAGATAVGLARVDGRADDVTLASLGASVRIRRSVAFVQAIIVCGLGAVTGTVVGLLPAIAIGAGSHSFPFAPPVLQLALTAVGIPVVIAVGAWLLVGTRRGDLTRRAAIA